MNRVRTAHEKPFDSLKTGQIWMLKDEWLEVKHVGKYLAEFSITRKPVQMAMRKHMRVSKQLESIQTVLKFLRQNKAVLGRLPKK